MILCNAILYYYPEPNLKANNAKFEPLPFLSKKIFFETRNLCFPWLQQVFNTINNKANKV